MENHSLKYWSHLRTSWSRQHSAVRICDWKSTPIARKASGNLYWSLKMLVLLSISHMSWQYRQVFPLGCHVRLFVKMKLSLHALDRTSRSRWLGRASRPCQTLRSDTGTQWNRRSHENLQPAKRNEPKWRSDRLQWISFLSWSRTFPNWSRGRGPEYNTNPWSEPPWQMISHCWM